MRKLITIQDVRNEAKQIGKQINQESFDAYVTRIQKRQLTELLGQSLFYDFINFLDNGFTNYAGANTRDSTTQITITGFDASAWATYSLRINDTVFVVVDTAVFGGADTVLTVSGYDLPTTITTLDYASENKYTYLLNGTTYTYDSNTIFFDGLRPFLSYHWIASYLIDGNLKQSDVGNFKITGDLIQTPGGRQLNQARSEYLQNATSEYNNIVQYLDTLSSTFPLWEAASQENLNSFDWIVI